MYQNMEQMGKSKKKHPSSQWRARRTRNGELKVEVLQMPSSSQWRAHSLAIASKVRRHFESDLTALGWWRIKEI